MAIIHYCLWIKILEVNCSTRNGRGLCISGATTKFGHCVGYKEDVTGSTKWLSIIDCVWYNKSGEEVGGGGSMVELNNEGRPRDSGWQVRVAKLKPLNVNKSELQQIAIEEKVNIRYEVGNNLLTIVKLKAAKSKS